MTTATNPVTLPAPPNANSPYMNVWIYMLWLWTKKGQIGGWRIGSDSIIDYADSCGMASTQTTGDDVRFYAGSTFANRASAPFRVTEGGVLTATSGSFGGTITIGTSPNWFKADSSGIWLGGATFGASPFSVSMAGALTATNAAVTGTITSTVGTIGGWSLGSTSLTAGSGANTVGLDSGGTNPAFYAGSATPGSAPFRVTKAGVMTATTGTFSGTLNANTFTPNVNIDFSANPGGVTGTSAVARFFRGDGTTVCGQMLVYYNSLTAPTGDLVIEGQNSRHVWLVNGMVVGTDYVTERYLLAGGTAVAASAVPASGITGTTLASGVTASSLTSFGSSIALGTPASGNLANCTFPTLNQNTTGSARSILDASGNALTTSGNPGTTTNFLQFQASGLTPGTSAIATITNLPNTQTSTTNGWARLWAAGQWVLLPYWPST